MLRSWAPFSLSPGRRRQYWSPSAFEREIRVQVHFRKQKGLAILPRCMAGDLGA